MTTLLLHDTTTTTPSDLLEEEELIIAVNDLVVNVSKSIRSEIQNDLIDVWSNITSYVESVVRTLREYQSHVTGKGRLILDLPHIAILLLLWFVAMWYLSSSLVKRSNTGSRKECDKNTKQSKNHHNEDDLLDNESNKLNSSLSSYTNTDPTANDEETVADEDLFEQLWETSIQNAAYSKLVLPPICRFIRPTTPTTPNRLLIHHRTTSSLTSTIGATNNSTNKNPVLSIVQHRSVTSTDVPTLPPPPTERRPSPEPRGHEPLDSSRGDDDTVPYGNNIIADDNPILRLQHYIREIYTLFSLFVSFDYTAAGTTLFRWMYQLYQLHFQHNHGNDQQQQHSDHNDTVTDENLLSETIPLNQETDPLITNDPHGLVVLNSADHRATPTRPGRRDMKHVENDEKKDDNTNTELDRQLYTIPQSPAAHDHLQEEQCVKAASTTTMDAPTENVVADNFTPPLASTQSPARGLIQRFSSDKYQYFDTVTSNESLRQMSIDIPVPDKYGYVLGDEFLVDPVRCTPLLVFVNSRSGPQQGNLLITQLRRLLNPIQIWDLSVNGDPRIILESFLVFTRLRILVCGGDGTVAWIIDTMEKLNVSSHRQYPPIAILPLGTGNDLSRILGWGGGYNNESLLVILEQISESYVSLLDQWEVTIDEVKHGSHQKHQSTLTKGFLNYLGVGADAQAALQVHNLREIRPQWFFSRLVNKAMYGIFGAEDILKATTIHVRKDIQLFADGVRVPLPHDSQGIIILNIDSYAGGVPLWSHGVSPPSSSENVINVHTINRVRSFSEVEEYRHHPIDKKYASQDILSALSRDDNTYEASVRNVPISTEKERYAQVTACDIPCSCQDGYLEIVSIRGAFHLGQIKVGLSNAQRLCQCREATIVIRNKVAVQVDGEPWRQNASTIKIRRKNEQAVMLHRSADDGGVETEMARLLEWAEARKMIDSHVHTLLMKEFSRRIESKSRQRRAAAVARQQHDNNNFMHFTSTIKKAISSGAMCST